MTENRAAFMPWLLWGFERQSYPNKELVVIDSSPQPWSISRANVRVIAAKPGTNVPTKRNLALTAARGDAIAWFDDDDWQHPERLHKLVTALGEKNDVAGSARSWFVDLYALTARPYEGRGSLIFNTAIYRTALARRVRFNEQCIRASDTPWLRALRSEPSTRTCLLEAEDLTFWLCHDENISNPRRKRQIQQPIAELAARVGPAWGDTLERLQALRAALPASPSLAPSAPWHHRLPRFEQRVRPNRIPLRTEVHSRVTGLSEVVLDADTEPTTNLDEIPDLTRPPRAEAYSDTLRSSVAAVNHLPSVIATAQARNAANVTPVTQEQKPSTDTTVTQKVALLLLSSPPSQSILHAFQSHLMQRFGGQFGETLTSVSSSRAEELRILPSLIAQFEREFVLVIRPRVMFFGHGVPFLAEAQRRLLVEPVTAFVTAHVGPPVGPLGTARSVTANEYLAWQGAKGYFRFRSPPISYFLCRRAWLLSRLKNREEQSLDSVLSALLRDANALAIALPSKGFYGLDFAEEFTQQSWTDLAPSKSELPSLPRPSCPQEFDNVMRSRRQL